MRVLHLLLVAVIPVWAGCAGEPAPVCEEEAWQWVFVGSDEASDAVSIDAVSITTVDGTERFTSEVLEWVAGSDAFAAGPAAAIGAPDGACLSLPEGTISYIADPGPLSAEWDYVTVYSCSGDGAYQVQLLVGDGDHQRFPASSSARGTSRFAASACGNVAPGLALTP